MLTMALSMVFYGALVKSTALALRRFNVGRRACFGMSFTDRAKPTSCCMPSRFIVTGFAGSPATILFPVEFGLASLAVRENNLASGVSRPLTIGSYRSTS